MEANLNAAPAPVGLALVQWVARVYENATPVVQCSLLDHLMHPLGVLALLTVGGGVFAKIRLRSGRPDAPIGIEYLQEVCPNDVMALVAFVQQRCEEVLLGLPQLLSPLQTTL